MTVQCIIDSALYQTLALADPGKEISRDLCGYRLSRTMGKAPEHSAWITVMGNRNTLAVASLADVSCIILAEGVTMNDEDLSRAKEENISVFSTELPVFGAALQIHDLLNKGD